MPDAVRELEYIPNEIARSLAGRIDRPATAMTSVPEVVLDARAELGECPVWSGHDACLFWLDIDGRLVHRYDPATGRDSAVVVDGRPGSVALTPDPDRLLVAIEHRLVDLEWSTGATTLRLELEEPDRATRLNDGRCDPVGRFWVGSMDDPSTNGARGGRLYRVDKDGTAVVEQVDVGVSNSLAFAPGGDVMYWSDTTRGLVWAYDYDTGSGSRSGGRVFLDFADLPGKPDGACVDETGCVWVACVYGWSLLRATPDGTVDRIIELPVEKPSMPAFGGRELDTLFVTSISSGGSHPAAPGQPLAGALLALTPGVRGIPEPLFTGGAARSR